MNPFRSQESHTIWSETQNVPLFSPLERNVEADVCVIGGGIAGLTTAYLLMKEGKKVCLLEDFEIGSGQSGRTTAQFSSALDDHYFELEKMYDESTIKLIADSHQNAIEKVHSIVLKEQIDCECERVNGYLFSLGDPRTEVLQKEYSAAHRAGLINVAFLDRVPLLFFDSAACLRFPQQLQLHPLKYLEGLARCLIQGGAEIYTQTHVSEIIKEQPIKVMTRTEHFVKCHSAVVATNTPINKLFSIHTKQAPYRTYVIGFKIPKESVTKALYWDTLEPYHYVRVESGPEYDVLIVGGEDHKTGQETHPETHFISLEQWARRYFSVVTDVIYKWSGQVMEPVDSLAYCGRNSFENDHVYVITGDSGDGMTHSTIGAMIITDQIMGRKNIWEDVYSPSRITFSAAGKYIKENSNVVAQYTEWLETKPKPDLSTVPLGQGVVFRDGLHMVAAYKNLNGKFDFLSAACPHLKGMVHWNDVEKSWDCPCHGSRFDPQGQVIEGPAKSDLKKLDDFDLNTRLEVVFDDSVNPTASL